MCIKKCSRCQKSKSTEQFYANRAKKDGFADQCKICHRQAYAARIKTPGKSRDKYLDYQRKYNRKHKRKRNEQSKEWYYKNRDQICCRQRLKKYDITEGEYATILCSQDNVCAICEQPETNTLNGRTRALHIDHCHETGKVRGLLCSSCNLGIGKFFHQPIILRNAAAYLENHE